MKLRPRFTKVAAVGVFLALIGVAAPAMAFTTFHEPEDPSFDGTTSSDIRNSDLIGVGSDTSMIAVHLLAEAWTSKYANNANFWTVGDTTAPVDFRVASFAACGQASCGTQYIHLPGGDIVRPNGSGAGIAKLGSSNDDQIDFARSSAALDATQLGYGLLQIPFAVDTIKMFVSRSVASNAPASLTIAQILCIYKGTCTTWNQVGGTSTAAIQPLIPQSSSGTAKFFKAQLVAANSGVDFTPVGTVVQEHDDTPIKNNANAIAPFSEPRAITLTDPTVIKPVSGWSAQRALYNIVRAADWNGTNDNTGTKGALSTQLKRFLGPSGFLCSTEGRTLIQQAGFGQILTAPSGPCGQTMTTAPASLATSAVYTTTTLAGSNPSNGAVTLSASVTGTTTPTGSVLFCENQADGSCTTIGAPVSTSGGVASKSLTGVSGGVHTYTAKFAGTTGSPYLPSWSSRAVTVKAASTLAVSAPASSYGLTRSVTATLTAGGAPVSGATVGIKVGTATAVNVVTNASGVATLAVSSTLAPASYTVAATFAGNTVAASTTGSASLVISKATPVIAESFPASTLAGQTSSGTVTLTIANSTVKPTGTVTIKNGTTSLVSGTLTTSGTVTLTIPKLTVGAKTLTVSYAGSTYVNAGTLNFAYTQN